MPADTKKAQTIRNLWYLGVAKPIEEANAVVAAIRAAITENSLAGEFTAGELNAMLAAETALAALAALPGITAAASKYEPTHRGKTIVVEGVNDG